LSEKDHKQIKMPDGQSLVEWITPTITDEALRYKVAMLSEKQIALVISALRMHTIMIHASTYDTSELGAPLEKTKFYPIESSIGRYFRDAGQYTLDQDL